MLRDFGAPKRVAFCAQATEFEGRHMGAEPENPDSGTDARPAKKRSLQPLLTLKPFVMRYRGRVLAALVALIVAACATLTMPVAVRRMIDYGFGASDAALIDKYFIALLVVGLVLALASSTRYYLVTWLGERVVADLRAAVFRHLCTLSPAFYEATHSGEVMSRLTADSTQIKAAVGVAASTALRNFVLLVGAVVMMFVTSAQLSVMVLGAIPLIVFPLVAYGRLVRRLSRRAQDSLAEASAYASENIAAVRTFQAFTNEATVAGRFSQAVQAAFQDAARMVRARSGLTAMAIFLVLGIVVCILWYGARDVLDGDMSAGALGQFVIFAVLAAGALSELSQVWGEVQQTAGAAERMAELLEIEPDVKSPADPTPLPEPARGEVAFEAVSFAYPTRGEVAALRDVSLTVRPGEIVAFVGPSGAGKSTMFNLLLRFYDVQSGRVLVDGVPVERADLTALRQRMAYVPQDTAMFSGTIADNIRYGSPEAADAEVVAAARTAFADDFIRALPDGYDTVLGERGVQLSGGQRQRIAIARAVLRDAPILLLDEATSALDSESEALVQQALERVMEARTTLVIAHRLATVKRADRIVVFDAGRIVEEGSHASLMAGGGTYAKLARLQFHAEPEAGDSPEPKRPGPPLRLAK